MHTIIGEFLIYKIYGLCLQASPDELSDLSCDEKTSKMLEDPTNMVSFV